MTKSIVWLVLMGIIACLQGLAQTDPVEEIEWLLADFSESSELEPDAEEVMDYGTQKRKININQTGSAELSGIPFLTQAQVSNLANYLNRYGEVFSLHELLAVEGFDSTTVSRLLPYIEVGPPLPRIKLTPGNLIREGRNELVVRYQQVMQRPAGYMKTDGAENREEPHDAYLGAPQRYYVRYRYTFFDQVIIGLSGDKDAGEEFFSGSQPLGMDFYSAFLAVRNLRWIKQIIVGNFRASFGQGLTVGRSSFASSVSFASAMKYQVGFIPSQSVCEYGYLRGVAVTAAIRRIELSAFFSSVRKDATVIGTDTCDSEELFFRSFTETGYHRTPQEMARKNQVKEQLYGGHVSYRGNFFILGIDGFYGSWNGTLNPPEEPYRRFSLRGNKFGGIGLDGRIRVGFAQVFGEFSMGLNGGKAWIAGIAAVPLSGIDILLICRSYQPLFQNLFSTAMAQNSQPANESGIYLRVQTQLIRYVTLSGYLDLFRFPWLRYQVSSPSDGIEMGLSGVYQRSGYWSLSLRYSMKQLKTNGSGTNGRISSPGGQQRNDLKAEWILFPIQALTLKSCFVLRLSQLDGMQQEAGYLGSQEIAYKRSGVLQGVRLKFTLFDTPFYNARIYSYEPDLLYSYSAPVLYGKGIRGILLLQGRITRWMDLWAWVGATSYTDRRTIGSGLEQIDGHLRSEVKVQVRVRL